MKSKYKLIKYGWMMLNIILLSIFFCNAGIINSFFTNTNFCILGYDCDDKDIKEFNCSEYQYRDEGIVANIYPFHQSFFETLEKVIQVSENEHQSIIKDILDEGSFKVIYDKYSVIFEDNYSLRIDDCCNEGRDYIQNMEELISNNYSGDCDDYALWLYIIAKEKGLNVKYVIGFEDDSGHAWIQIKVNEEWIDYDSSCNQFGWNIVSQKYLREYYYEG